VGQNIISPGLQKVNLFLDENNKEKFGGSSNSDGPMLFYLINEYLNNK
jgi:hypothetical protein